MGRDDRRGPELHLHRLVDLAFPGLAIVLLALGFSLLGRRPRRAAAGAGAGHEPLLDGRATSRVEFATARGPLRAVDGVSFELGDGEVAGPRRRERLAARPSPAAAILRLLPARPGARSAARAVRGARSAATWPRPALRRLRGRGIAMIFQNPSTASRPGDDRSASRSPRRCVYHQGLSAGGGARRGDRAAAPGRHSRRRARGSTPIRTSSAAACASAR